MVADQLGGPQRPNDASRAAFREEQRQAELRRKSERNKQELHEREALIKQQHGAELAEMIDRAGKIVQIEDEQIKARAVDFLAKSIANSAVQRGQISDKDLLTRCYDSIDQARQFEAQQRQQQGREREEHREGPPVEQVQDQPRDENPTHYYAALKETHRQVDNAILAEQEAGLDNGADRGQAEGRYAPLDETHREVAEASKPLNRSEREAEEAEAQSTAGEMGDAKQSRANMIRALRENFARENQNENEAEQGMGRDRDMSD